MSNLHNSVQFFIEQNLILIRPLNATEKIASLTYNELIDNYLVYGEFTNSPEKPLREYCGSKTDHDFVYVAILEGHEEKLPVGIALYHENDDGDTHEFSVMVDAQYAVSRLAKELTAALVKDATKNGVKTLQTLDSSENEQLAHIAKELKMCSSHYKYGKIHYSLLLDYYPELLEILSRDEHT